MAVIIIGVFTARAWSLTSKAKGPPDHAGIPAGESFDLKVHYHHRPPYYVKTAAGVEGLCATPVTEALNSAGIKFHWTETPPKRQLHLLQQNPLQDCIIGWYKTREREKYARYSTVIYQDQPAVALVRHDDPRIPEHCTVAELLGLPDIVMLSRTGYSYGTLVDKALAQIKPLRIDSGVDSSEWLSILYTRRADFLLIAPEEADYLLSSTQLPRNAFRHVVLTDMPPGGRRYVLFSRAVPPVIVDRFNGAFRSRDIGAKIQIAAGDRP
jgi:ABC-type amino acid transport substrate-binding protein